MSGPHLRWLAAFAAIAVLVAAQVVSMARTDAPTGSGAPTVAAGADAAALAAVDAKYPNRDDFVIMPPIPWDPYQNDFWSNEILFEIQAALDAGDTTRAEFLARRDGLRLSNGTIN